MKVSFILFVYKKEKKGEARMKEITKNDLFKIQRNIVIGPINVKTGVNEFSRNIRTFSKYRDASVSMTSPSKITVLSPSKITVLLYLFTKYKDVNIFESSDKEGHSFVVIEKGQGEFIYAYKDSYRSVVVKSTFAMSHSDPWLAIAALATSSNNMTDEVKSIISPIVNNIVLGDLASACNNSELLNLFCDSLYYSSISPIQKITILDGELSVKEVIAAYRAGSIKKHNVIANTGLAKFAPKSQLEKTIPSNADTDKDYMTAFMNDVKSGKYKVEYAWSENQKMYQQTKSFLDDFIPSKQFETLTKKVKFRLEKILNREKEGMEYLDVIGKDYINVLMVGKPGTGKTTLAYALSAATGLPVYTTAISHNTDESEFSGITTIVDGKPQFCSNDFLDAYTNGGIIVLEEINLANPSVLMGGLGQAIEYPFIIKENGYKDVRRHPMCVVIGTMNVGTAGSKPLNAAFANRFHQTYTLEDPSKESLIDVLCSNTSLDREVCAWMYDVYMNIIAILADPDVDCECDKDDIIAGLSLRTCIGALRNMEEGCDCWTAVKDSLIGSIARQDLHLSKEVYETITSTMRKAPGN